MVIGGVEKAVTQKIEIDLVGEPGVADRERNEGRLLVDQDDVEGGIKAPQVLGDGQARPAAADHYDPRTPGGGNGGPA
jgi:hypothetical protein